LLPGRADRREGELCRTVEDGGDVDLAANWFAVWSAGSNQLVGMNERELEGAVVRWTAAMRRGDFPQAWRETDRIELPRRHAGASGIFVRGRQHLLWDGTPIDGGRVLIRCDHGLGDTLQFIRYVPLVRARAREVMTRIQSPLMPLVGACGSFGRIIADDAPLTGDFDVQIEVMELPYAFRSTVATLPRDVPYLAPPAAARDGAVLSRRDEAALHVGLVWAAGEWDRSRSVPLECLAPLARMPGACFYSLQQGSHRAEWRHAPFPLKPLSHKTEAIMDAATAMLKLDLIITVDGMTAHLAGALGRPVWLMLKHEPDWRWLEHGAESPWYPTMRLFRNDRPGDWSEVAKRVAEALASLVARSGGLAGGQMADVVDEPHLRPRRLRVEDADGRRRNIEPFEVIER
jgi:hypothetical protein